VGIGGDHGEGVTGIDIASAAQHHVAVAVAIGRGAERRGLVTVHQVHEFTRVHEIRIRMPATEVRQRLTVHHRTRRRAEALLEDRLRVGARDRVHGVETQTETPAAEHLRQGLEVKQAFHELRVIAHGIDDLHLHAAQVEAALHGEIDVRCLAGQVVTDGEALAVDRVGYRLRGGTAVGAVELDAEVALRATGVVAGGEDDAAVGSVLADQARGGGGRQQAIPGDDHPLEAVRRRHRQDALYRLAIVVASVTADYQGAARAGTAGRVGPLPRVRRGA
jgi:hypothetical protein